LIAGVSSSKGNTNVQGVVLPRPGSAVAVEDLELEPPRAGEVRVRLLASGVCHSDLHLADGDWSSEGPVVLGHEGCGIVEEVGPGVDPALYGRKVVLDWFTPCGVCRSCLEGTRWTCTGTLALENRLPDGTTRFHRVDGSPVLPFLGLGTFSERTIVAAPTAIPVPDEVDAAVGALIGCSVSTGIGAVLKTARVPPGATVVVFGLGGVGLSVVMGAALAGATTIVGIDRHHRKIELARDLGATQGIIAADDPGDTLEAVQRATNGGADFAFEAIGLSGTIEQTIRSVRGGGCAVLVGMTPLGVRASFDAFDVVDRSLRILGSNYGFAVGPLDFPRYAALHLAGRLPIERLIEQRISLQEVGEALEATRRGDGARRVITFPHHG
jgi:S-(hydroxymethyl)glutathione dehydrogenase / alcohol dehydrogenase